MHYNRNVFYFKYFQLLMCSAGDKKSIESIMEARGHSILSTGSLISLDTPVLLSAEPSSAEEKNATAEIKLNTIEIVTETTKRTRERLADIEKKLEESSLRSVFTKATEIKSDSELQSAKPLSTREKISTAEVKLNTGKIVTETTTRTRERLADIERKLAESSISSTSTKTRERKNDTVFPSDKPSSTRQKIARLR